MLWLVCYGWYVEVDFASIWGGGGLKSTLGQNSNNLYNVQRLGQASL